ncbi:unnamed protein product [Linum tenue]|uniref:Uncharacterized protein n=1 Tax=Linum tenue TaxID=586396 RepID=A0AAV0IR45_9ROSI|nr:unnamed protein product [Linum tenue]
MDPLSWWLNDQVDRLKLIRNDRSTYARIWIQHHWLKCTPEGRS